LNAHPGDTLLFSLDSFQIEVDLVGIFADTLFNQLIDLDGKPLTPDKVVLLSEGSDEELPTYAVVSCEPSEIIITTWQAAYNFGGVAVSRIDVHLEGDQDVLATARRMALERDYWVWSATAGQVNLTKLESYFEAKGFSVLIPWIIVIFTVVATMLNAIFERRREIAILSSIGLNPSHITALFVAEATIIGFIGGGVGYLSGLGMYRLMSRLSITLAVRQKVSAVWCVGALGIAAVAVVTGAVVALRSSVIVTPSLLRKWKADEKPSTAREPWVFTLPIKVRPTEINAFLTYVKRCLERYAVEVDAQRIGRLKQTEEEMPQVVTKRIHFNYYYGEGSADRFFTVNQLVATKRTDDEVYTLTLSSRGAESWTYKTASFVRAFILTWSAMKK
jgi:hypothetical protein